MDDIPISKILSKYDTDKVTGHCYGATYDKLFSGFNRSDKLNILEVGTQKGGSLLAWKEYFPNATVTGVDIVDVVLPEYRSKDITYIISDIKDFKTDQMFDIVIDDGSHFIDDVVFVINTYTEKLKPRGILIVEDIQNFTAWSKKFDLIDLRGINGNYDDVLLVLPQ